MGLRGPVVKDAPICSVCGLKNVGKSGRDDGASDNGEEALDVFGVTGSDDCQTAVAVVCVPGSGIKFAATFACNCPSAEAS